MDPKTQGYGHSSSAAAAPRPAGPTPTVRKVPFNALPASSRERFIAAVQGTGRPSPALSGTTMKTGAIVLWGLFVLTAGSVLVTMLMDRFGSYWRPRLSLEVLGGCMLGFWAFGYGVLAIWRRVSLDRRLPFRRGRYVFPTDVVIATGATLELLPMGRVARIDAVHQHQNGRYVRTDIRFIFDGGRTEAFSVFNRTQAQTTLDQLQSDQQRLRAAAQAGDVSVMADLDPFIEARVHGLLDDPEQMAQIAAHATDGQLASGLPVWLKWASVSALGFAILAVPVFFVRNHLSDEEAFAAAVATGEVYALREYMNGEGSHAQEVANIHLPAAAFGEAQRTNTVTALRDFVRDYPNAQQVPHAREVIHQRFEQVKATFVAQANPSDPSMLRFMEVLLAWLENHDSPPVQVRFNPPSTEALAAMDTELRSRHENIIPIAPHFTPQASASREETVTNVLRRGFGAVFPDDVMSLVHSGRITPGAPEPEVPTVNVSYVVRPSGAIYVDESDNRQFVGIHVDFDVSMKIPGVATEHRFTMPVEPPQRFTVSYNTYGGVGGGPSEGAVYATMASRAFDQLSARLRMTFFKPGTTAFEQAVAETNRQPPPPAPGAGAPGLLGGPDGPNLDGLSPELRQAIEDLQRARSGAGAN